MLKNVSRFAGVVAFVFLFALIGVRISQHAKKLNYGTGVAARNGIARDPAAIHKSYDFSQLDGDALDQASKQRLVSGAVIRTEDSGIGVELGDFVVKGTDGQKSFACQQYSQIILQFEGDGSAVDGNKPEMEVEGACEVSGDINTIAALWIPVAKILGEPVADGEFDFRDNHPVKVRFANLIHDWPREWRLKGLRLSNPDHPGSEVGITDKEMRQIAAKPVIIKFE